MKKRRVYLDNNATTPLDPEVKRVIMESLDLYGNASSMHTPGREANKKLEQARSSVARLIHASEKEIVFTGCGTESNNAVLSLLYSPEVGLGGRRRFVTSSVEHPSIYELKGMLERRGIEVTMVPVDETGKVRMDAYMQVLGSDVALVSIMLANNETGTIQDVAAMAAAARKYGALVHTDAVQAAGKIDVDVQALGADYLSMSAHKLYAPKGTGALYVREGAPFVPLLRGGHQEDGKRAGTYDNIGILAFGKASELAADHFEEDAVRMRRLRDMLEEGIQTKIGDIHVNGHPEDRLAGTLNVSFYGAEGESILLYLDMEGIAVSTGSACATGSLEPSYVLVNAGLSSDLAHGSIRFSLGRFTTEEEIAYVLKHLPPVIARLRRMSTV